MISHVNAELPDCRFPLCFIVDDGAPCVNPLYFYRKDVDKLPPGQLRDSEALPSVKMVKDIPLRFLEEYAEWTYRNNIRGKFSVIPYPMGLGSITTGLKGYNKEEVDEWLKIVREKISPLCDITPEILTHTLGLDIRTGKLLSIPEQDFTSSLSLNELTEYMMFATRILKDAGLIATGVTQPCYYGGDQKNVYARAVLAAFKKTNGLKLAFYFLNVDGKAEKVLPEITYLDKAKKEAVVSIISATTDWMWECVAGKGEVLDMADYFLSANGGKGRFIDLMKTGSYLVFHSHWQCLYGNGTRKGFFTLKEIVRRVEENMADNIQWMKTSEVARYFITTKTYGVNVQGDERNVTLIFTSPFECPDFTISFDINTNKNITITRGCKVLKEVSFKKELKENSWFREGKRAYLSFFLENEAKIKIELADS